MVGAVAGVELQREGVGGAHEHGEEEGGLREGVRHLLLLLLLLLMIWVGLVV